MLKCSEEERKERQIEKPLGKQPFKCPICGGNGLVTSGFYNQTRGYSTMALCQESCRSCGGTGIVWRGE